MVKSKIKIIKWGLCTDGEETQIRILTELMNGLTEMQRLEIIKWAGSCSGTLQPNDLMRGFAITRRFITSQVYRDWEPSYDPNKQSLAARNLQSILTAKKMAKGHRDTFVKFVDSLSFLKPQAFSKKNILKGWSIYNSDSVDTILEQCTTWPDFSSEQKQRVRDAIPFLTTSMGAGLGMIDEDLMQKLLGPEILGTLRAAPTAPETNTDSEDPNSDSDSSAEDARTTRGAARVLEVSRKKALKLRPVYCQRTAVITSPGCRFLVAHRNRLKLFKEAFSDLKEAIKIQQQEQLSSRPVAGSGETSSSSTATTSTNSASASSAAATKKPKTASTTTSTSASGSAGGPQPAAASAGKRVVRRQKRKQCEDMNCGSNSDDLVQCTECWATFCTECYTEVYKTRHQDGRFCMEASNRKRI